MKEREVALATAAETGKEAAALRAELRTAAKAINRVIAIASAMQRDGQDLEGAGDHDHVRSYLDGRLLQRTGYLIMVGNEIALKLRQLVQGTVDLEKDCTDFPGHCAKCDEEKAAIAETPA